MEPQRADFLKNRIDNCPFNRANGIYAAGPYSSSAPDPKRDQGRCFVISCKRPGQPKTPAYRTRRMTTAMIGTMRRAERGFSALAISIRTLFRRLV